MRSFVKINPSQNGEITLSFTDLGKSYTSLEFLTWQICLHGLQSHNEPTLDWPCSAAHNFGGNAILQSIIAIHVIFKGLMEPVFNQALKAGHVGFVTDTGYIRYYE